MGDIWGFLLQTLTASGAAVFLLVIKAMFRDKLSPRWQFSVWGLLAAAMLVPAGLGGRYVLLNWPVMVELAKSLLTGNFTLTRVTAPVPLLPDRVPGDLWDWLFVVYFAGIVLLAVRYILSYVRLRLALSRGKGVDSGRFAAVAERYGLMICPAVEAEGLSSAFVCGVLAPVLALPAGVETDEKVILHELLHLKHRDAAWGLLICFFRCVHWCNPLLWYCADRAGNDLEALCDQRVLEKLEGEERRAYGHILLSMANEKYARAPGTTSMANGGKNIRRRIESIARFRKYPAGMGLVSLCVALVLVGPLVFGTPAKGVYSEGGRMLSDRSDVILSLASARTTPCTTVAGALDTYAKALLSDSGAYRAMCAPIELQEEIAAGMLAREKENLWPTWEAGLPGIADNGRQAEGYYIYNLEFKGDGVYTALLVIPLKATQEQREDNNMALAVQNLRVEKEADRWVVIPVDELEYRVCMEESLRWGVRDLPTYRYSGTAEDFRIEVHHQKSFVVDNSITEKHDMDWFMYASTTRFDTVPKPDAEFDMVYHSQWSELHYLGTENEKRMYTSVGLTTYPMEEGEERPELRLPGSGNSSGGSNSGEDWSSRKLIDWESPIHMGGGGTGRDYKGEEEKLPVCYAADFYINRLDGSQKIELSLLPEEGGAK